MNYKLNLTPSNLIELEKIKNSDTLLVPIAMWEEHIEKNLNIDRSDFPPSQFFAGYVITEREWFTDIVRNLKNLYIENKRLTAAEGGVWLTCKLELKKIMPKHDIFNAAHRQSGSFRSKC